MTEQVASVLTKHGQFQLECRGPIDVKGKGRLTTYFVVTPYDSIDDLDQAEIVSRTRDGSFRDEDEQEAEPPPTLEDVSDEVEELCADKSGAQINSVQQGSQQEHERQKIYEFVRK